MKRVSAIIVVTLLAGCESSERREAERLADAVARFRRASNEEEPSTAAALRAVPCTVDEVCRARDTCLHAADLIARSLRLRDDVTVGLAMVDAGKWTVGSAEARGLAEKLDEAERVLQEGFQGLPDCDERMQSVKRRYRF